MTDDDGVSVTSTCVAVSGAEDVCRIVPNDGALARIRRGTTCAVVGRLEAAVRCANGFAEAAAGTAAAAATAAATAATTRPLMVACSCFVAEVCEKVGKRERIKREIQCKHLSMISGA